MATEEEEKEEEKERKTAIWEMAKQRGTYFPRSVVRRLFKECGDSRCGSRAILFRRYAHRLAIPVHQGNDPTLPYQAWVIRKSAMLFPGFAPWGRKAFSAHKPIGLGGVTLP